MKTLRLIISYFGFGWVLVCAGTYGGGNGTQSNPYLIGTAAHLAELSSTPADWATGIYFEQTANITVAGEWTPIGNSTNNFRGNYNGKGFTVSGVSIPNYHRSGYWAFFGYTNGATIQNLGLVSVSISEKSEVGGLIGYAQGTTVSNCYTTGTVSGYYDYVGGLIAETQGTVISNCYSTATVTGGTSGSGSYTGGLVGKCTNSSPISNSYHITGSVSGKDYVGGLVGGLESSSSVSQCYSSGSVGGTFAVGGLIGHLDASVHNSYSRANVSNSGSNSGGLVGQNVSGSIDKCYSTGTATGSADVGGLLGYNNGGTTTNSFWDTQTSGRSSSAGGTGKTTSEMKTLSTFTSAGWDFEAETANGTNDYWDLDYSGSINNGYPYLSWQDGEDVSLPVELTSFSAECKGGSVVLTWRTESETDNLGFIIERKNVGTNGNSPSSWSQIASYTTDNALAGHGSTSEAHDYSYTDAAVVPGATYLYRLGDVDYSGRVTWHKEVKVKVGSEEGKIADDFQLGAVYPNPFNASFTVSLILKRQASLRLELCGLNGQVIKVVADGVIPAGTHRMVVDCSAMSSGIYLLQSKIQNVTQTRKVILLR